MPNLGSLWKKVSGALQPAESGVGIDVPSVDTNDIQFDAAGYSDVSGSRSDNTWETNNTEYPLAVTVVVKASGAGSQCFIDLHENTSQTNNKVDQGANVAHDSQIVRSRVTAIIPPGHDYKANWTGTLTQYQEQEVGKP